MYHRPLGEARPRVCTDEVPEQLVGEVRTPPPARPGTPARYDYEDERAGVAALFMIPAPLAGRRDVRATDRRTAVDFAEVLRWVVEDLHPDAARVVADGRGERAVHHRRRPQQAPLPLSVDP